MVVICPVCGAAHYEKRTMEVPHDRLSNVGSNTLFAECARITRGPDDEEQWKVEIYGHTAEQAFDYRDS